MKYTKIVIPEEISQKMGIKPINIQRLSNVIAFIGKNGSGKTRILDLIENNPFFIDTILDNIPDELGSYFNLLEKFEKMDKLKKEIEKNSYNNTAILSELNTLQHMFAQNNMNPKKIFAGINDLISKKYIRRIKYEEISSLQQTIEKSDEQNFFEGLLENTVKDNNYNELMSINRGALEYLKSLPHKLVADKYECIEDNNKFLSKDSHKRFIVLKKYIKIFLNKELEWDKNSVEGKIIDTKTSGSGFNVTYKGFFKLNGREFKYSEFSNGEKILFAYAILFFLIEQNQKLNIKESILIIDEPELHLHADSEIDLINKLRKVVSEKGQLIIATHSINILSTLNYEEIFVVKDGEILHPSGKSLALSLSELLPIEEKVNKLSDLFYSIDNWSFVNFISQCFSEPEAIKLIKEDDLQLVSIKDMIKTKINNPSHSIFLDFGAGRGRIFKGLLSDDGIFPKLKYYALEPRKEYHSELIKLGIKKLYSDYIELSDNTFDFILLSNVLHEIPVTSWEVTLNKVISSLKDNGSLMIVEPRTLFKGEKIDDSGFIVLSEEEIQILFKLPNNLQSFYTEDSKEKITAVMIQKSDLTNIDNESINNALIKLQENSLKNAEELMSNQEDTVDKYAYGRKMAFYSMQSINAQICLKKISTPAAG